jgi:predicted enzyme related to lactoylglutathione lyase
MNYTVGRIQQIAVTVANVDVAVRYYRDILGLSYLFSPGPNLAFLTDGSVRIMLSLPQGAGVIRANSILYFRVSEIEKTYEAIVARGSAAERPPQLTARMPDHDLWIGFLRDPDGNLVGLMEEKRRGSES